MISIQLITTKASWYESERQLRNKVLLRPIGLPDHAWEMHDEQSWHFVALDQDQVFGCVILVPLGSNGESAQLMQMAVDDNYQGKGVGKLLVKELLRFCQSQKIREVVCHAWETAVSFYLNLGFAIYGELFEEVGIPHFHMRIELNN